MVHRRENQECPPTAGRSVPPLRGECSLPTTTSPMVNSPDDEAWNRTHRLPPVGRLRREGAFPRACTVARAWRGRRCRPFFTQHREPRTGTRPLPRDPILRRPGQPPSADRRRPGGRARGALQGTPVYPVSPGPRLLPVLLPERVRSGSGRRGNRRRASGGGDRHEFRPGPRRGEQPAQSGDRGPCLLRRPAHRGCPRDRVCEGIALPGNSSGRKTFPGSRGHLRRLPPGAAGCPGGNADTPSPRTAPLPTRRPGGDSRAHDRPCDVPRARPHADGHIVPEDPARPSAGPDAVPGNDHLGCIGDEGDRGSVRHR